MAPQKPRFSLGPVIPKSQPWAVCASALVVLSNGTSVSSSLGRLRAVIKFRPMEITINGEPRQFPSPLTVAALVEALGYGGKRIAIERNGEIVPRGRHAEVALADGDRLEIVVAVGGG
jgi:sulfur carrier protein